MTDRAEIERLLNATGRTLEGLPERYDIVRWNRAANMPGAPLDTICHQSDVIELLVGALRDALEERDAALAKVPKWISVEERLPEKRGTYLCNYEFKESGRIVMSCDYLGDKRWSFMTAHVTHWMPLPDAPEEEE